MKSSKEKVKLFAYGTLKRGKPLHQHWMYRSSLVREDEVEGEMFALGWYPAVLLNGQGTVKGEVWEMPVKDFRVLKGMEEAAGYRTVETLTKGGEQVKLFEYLDDSIRHRYVKIDNF